MTKNAKRVARTGYLHSFVHSNNKWSVQFLFQSMLFVSFHIDLLRVDLFLGRLLFQRVHQAFGRILLLLFHGLVPSFLSILFWRLIFSRLFLSFLFVLISSK